MVALKVFVNAKEAVRYFRRCSDSIKEGHPVKHVIEWNGGPGLGKTSLVRKLIKEQCTPDKMSWTYVDFKCAAEEEKNYYHDPTLLIWDMIIDLRANQNIDTRSLEQAIEGYRNVKPSGDFIDNYMKLPRNGLPVDWLDAMNRVCTTFIDITEALGRKKRQIRPVIFFIDETEYVEFELADWLEEVLLSRLVLKEYGLVVWTGRRRWRWKRPELRNQLVRECLGHFESQDVEDYIKLNYPTKADVLLSWVDAVHRLSGGHGYSVALAVHVLDQWLQDHPDEKLPVTYEAMECELLSALRQEFVLKYAFDGLDDQISESLEMLALLRSLDTNLVNHVLVRNRQTELDNSYEQALNLLDRLKRTDLLIWKNTSYAVGDDIRHVLNAYYRRCKPDVYARVHERAVEGYSEMLEKAQDNLNLLMIEKLYHLAALSQTSESVNLEEVFRDQLNEYLIRPLDRDFLRYTLEQLKAMLENDSELIDLTGGLSADDFTVQVQALIDRLSPRGSV